MSEMLDALSDRLADAAGRAAPGLLAIEPDERTKRSAFLWADGVAVTSAQNLPESGEWRAVLPGGQAGVARLAGRDPGTNVAVFRVEAAAPTRPPVAEPRAGALALALGSRDGAPTVRLGAVHFVGPAWDSMAGGRIDRLIQLDLRLSAREEGGPVVAAEGGLFGMSTLGPRRRPIVIPAATLDRVVPQLLEAGQVRQGWLGLGLQPVGLPQALRATSARDAGLMVVSLAAGGPAEQAGVLPGDILLDVAGEAAPHPRAVARALAGEAVGRPVQLRLLRGGAPVELQATVALRPAA